jgi:hypothetical protein
MCQSPVIGKPSNTRMLLAGRKVPDDNFSISSTDSTGESENVNFRLVSLLQSLLTLFELLENSYYKWV